MSEELLKAFLEKVKGDTGLQKKVRAAATPQAAVKIANAEEISINSRDIQSMQSESVESSDEELERASAGRRRRGQCGWSLLGVW